MYTQLVDRLFIPELDCKILGKKDALLLSRTLIETIRHNMGHLRFILLQFYDKFAYLFQFTAELWRFYLIYEMLVLKILNLQKNVTRVTTNCPIWAKVGQNSLFGILRWM